MPDIRHSIQISADPETVYPLVATAKGFSQGWAADVTESAGAVDLGFFNRATVFRLRLTIDKPAGLAQWTFETGAGWSGTHIALRLEKRGSGTVVQFTHGGWQADTDYFVSCNTTWGEPMFRLKAAAEGRPRGPLFLAIGMTY